jgi:hypothetical protein
MTELHVRSITFSQWWRYRLWFCGWLLTFWRNLSSSALRFNWDRWNALIFVSISWLVKRGETVFHNLCAIIKFMSWIRLFPGWPLSLYSILMSLLVLEKTETCSGDLCVALKLCDSVWSSVSLKQISSVAFATIKDSMCRYVETVLKSFFCFCFHHVSPSLSRWNWRFEKLKLLFVHAWEHELTVTGQNSVGLAKSLWKFGVLRFKMVCIYYIVGT